MNSSSDGAVEVDRELTILITAQLSELMLSERDAMVKEDYRFETHIYTVVPSQGKKVVAKK